MIKIKFTTETPLCQKEKSENGKITVQKMAVGTTNKAGTPKSFATPIYSASGYRGAMRRESFALILEALAKKGIRNKKGDLMSAEDFHIMNAGGGSFYQRKNLATDNIVRELNPLVSLYGASLAIEGKLKVSTMMPFKVEDDGSKSYYVSENSEDGSLYSPIVAIMTDTDTDLQSFHEYVLPGVDFYGSISYKKDLTDVEKGMLYRTMERMTQKSLGSATSQGFGVVSYKIEFDDKNSKLETAVNQYKEIEIDKKIYTQEVQKCLDAFNEYLENISLENIEIDKILR